MNDNACHLTGDLGRVVEAWQKLSAEARLMIMASVLAADRLLYNRGNDTHSLIWPLGPYGRREIVGF
mgnify:CR=1 FL=1|jgi:hypothetical protein